LLPGPFEVEDAGDWGQKRIRWTVYVELFERYLDGGTSEQALEAMRQDVVDLFGAYPTLNGTSGVILASVQRGNELRYIYDRDRGGPHFVMQRIALEVIEEASYDGSGEYA